MVISCHVRDGGHGFVCIMDQLASMAAQIEQIVLHHVVIAVLQLHRGWNEVIVVVISLPERRW